MIDYVLHASGFYTILTRMDALWMLSMCDFVVNGLKHVRVTVGQAVVAAIWRRFSPSHKHSSTNLNWLYTSSRCLWARNTTKVCLWEVCQLNVAVSLCQVREALSEICSFDSSDVVWHKSVFLQLWTAGQVPQLYLDITGNSIHRNISNPCGNQTGW